MASAQLQPQLHERWLREKTVRDVLLMEGSRRRLVEVPYTASLTDTMNALVANNVSAVPVAAPPGQWIGAGGSMILESDRTTGAIRKHYIGMVTMLDIIHHIAEATDEDDGNTPVSLDDRMAVSVSAIIGHSTEGLNLWTLNPSTSLLDCLEVFSKGIHRALVPLDSVHVAGVEISESSPGYQMLTQMDVVRFIMQRGMELRGILTQSVAELGAVNEYVFSVKRHTRVIEAIKFMRSASVTALPIVESSGQDREVANAKGKKLIGTFSATDLRACPIALLRPSLNMGVMEFIETIAVQPSTGQGPAADVGYSSPARKLIACYRDTSLAEVMNEAVNWHVHRVWVVDHASGMLSGLVSLTDMFKALRVSILGTDA
ncbi:hypothetical protein ACLOJK_035375 [Asimina triloba]